MGKVPVAYKVEPATKQWIDLMSVAMDIDKSRVVDEAVRALVENRRGALSEYLDGAHRLLEADDLGGLAEMFVGAAGPEGYAGGPVGSSQKSKA